jgi:hypothetical protein
LFVLPVARTRWSYGICAPSCNLTILASKSTLVTTPCRNRTLGERRNTQEHKRRAGTVLREPHPRQHEILPLPEVGRLVI